MLRVAFAELEAALHRATLHLGLEGERAALCARLFAETDRDGVRTHGLARFPRFAAMVRNRSIDTAASPTFVAGFGGIERWKGNRGPGNLNAHAAMARAMALARLHGIGAVALGDTNHWMRGGTYGWQAATEGLFAACWTNTLANTPAWGTARPTVGNNPIVLAVPRAFAGEERAPVVLDMAMTQFSMGSLAAYVQRGEQLPVPGGWDAEGELTHDPAAIEASKRTLPIGFWKGSGLALTLDMFAAMLSGGLATHQLPLYPLREAGLSQVFLAIDPLTFGEAGPMSETVEGILADLHGAPPEVGGRPPRYPGEETLRLRGENLRLGVPVDAELWRQLTELAV